MSHKTATTGTQGHIFFLCVLVILGDLPESVLSKDLEAEITLAYNLNNCQNIRGQKKSTKILKLYCVWYVYLHEQALTHSANFTCTNTFINSVMLFLWLEGCPVTPGFSNIWTSASLIYYKRIWKERKKITQSKVKVWDIIQSKCWALNLSVVLDTSGNVMLNEGSITRIRGNLKHYYTHRESGLVNIWGVVDFFFPLADVKITLGHSSMNDFWWQWCPSLIPALMLWYSGLSQQIFLCTELFWRADTSEKTNLFWVVLQRD